MMGRHVERARAFGAAVCTHTHTHVQPQDDDVGFCRYVLFVGGCDVKRTKNGVSGNANINRSGRRAHTQPSPNADSGTFAYDAVNGLFDNCEHTTK